MYFLFTICKFKDFTNFIDFIFAQKIGSSLFKIHLKSFHRKTFKLEVFDSSNAVLGMAFTPPPP
jgi:hypothetical protein